MIYQNKPAKCSSGELRLHAYVCIEGERMRARERATDTTDRHNMEHCVRAIKVNQQH